MESVSINTTREDSFTAAAYLVWTNPTLLLNPSIVFPMKHFPPLNLDASQNSQPTMCQVANSYHWYRWYARRYRRAY